MRQRSDVLRTELPRQSDFIIDAYERSAKQWALHVMKVMRDNFYDNYSLRAVGRRNVQACEQTAKLLSKWIIIQTVEARRMNQQVDTWILIRFKRNRIFREDFEKCK